MTLPELVHQYGLYEMQATWGLSSTIIMGPCAASLTMSMNILHVPQQKLQRIVGFCMCSCYALEMRLGCWSTEVMPLQSDQAVDQLVKLLLVCVCVVCRNHYTCRYTRSPQCHSPNACSNCCCKSIGVACVQQATDSWGLLLRTEVRLCVLCVAAFTFVWPGGIGSLHGWCKFAWSACCCFCWPFCSSPPPPPNWFASPWKYHLYNVTYHTVGLHSIKFTYMCWQMGSYA